MSELRHDPINRQWVIVRVDRSRRPGDFQFPPAVPEDDAPPCAFCPGQEAGTPPELYAVRPNGKANSSGWSVRVVPNKSPVLGVEGQLDRQAVGQYDRMRGIGAHEIVIETERHDLRPFQIPELQLASALVAARTRMLDLMKDPRFKYVLLHKNHGKRAGASVFHPFQQLVATPVTPLSAATQLTSHRSHFHIKERCLSCDIISHEIDAGTRIVNIDDHFVSIAPYASRFPFEIHLFPRLHAHQFTSSDDLLLERLASHMLKIFGQLHAVLGDPPFNWMVINAPNENTEVRRAGYWSTLAHDYHWHIEILPRLTPLVGFEWGTGLYINQTAPEDAAAFLRDATAEP